LTLAIIRPDDWNWLLLFHVLLAMIAVGGVLTVVAASLSALRAAGDHLVMLRVLAFRANVLAVLPGLVGVYVFGLILSDREFGDETPDWLDISWRITEVTLVVGGVLLAILQHWVARRVRRGNTGGWPAALASYLPLAVLAALAVVVFLMSGKP
jgi:hypothetical protein